MSRTPLQIEELLDYIRSLVPSRPLKWIRALRRWNTNDLLRRMREFGRTRREICYISVRLGIDFCGQLPAPVLPVALLMLVPRDETPVKLFSRSRWVVLSKVRPRKLWIVHVEWRSHFPLCVYSKARMDITSVQGSTTVGCNLTGVF